MLKEEQKTRELTLNKLSLVVTSLRYVAAMKEGSPLASFLNLISGDLEDCLLALDDPQRE